MEEWRRSSKREKERGRVNVGVKLMKRVGDKGKGEGQKKWEELKGGDEARGKI